MKISRQILGRVCRKAVGKATSSSWPKERWVQHGQELRGRAGGWPGTPLPGGALLRLRFAEGRAGELPERLGHHCSPTSTAAGGDDAGPSLFTKG